MILKKTLRGIVLCTLLSVQACGSHSEKDEPLTAKAYQHALERESSALQLIDVRTAEEFVQGHLEGAQNVDIKNASFQAEMAGLDKSKAVFVYCLGGGRSAKAAKTLKELGFQQVYDLAGGVLAWKNEKLPLTAPEMATKPDLITRADFDQVLNDHTAVLVDFYADWCIPCKEMEPSLQRLTKDYEGKVLVYRVNIDQAKALTSELKIEGIPVFHLYKKGTLIEEVQGFQEEKDLKALLDVI